jgi:hypothetical protein
MIGGNRNAWFMVALVVHRAPRLVNHPAARAGRPCARAISHDDAVEASLCGGAMMLMYAV